MFNTQLFYLEEKYRVSCRSISNFEGQYPIFSFKKNHQKYTNLTLNKCNFDNCQFFPLVTVLREIIEFYLQYDIFCGKFNAYFKQRNKKQSFIVKD